MVRKNKKWIKIITLIGIIYAIMKTGVETFFLLVGGVIIWASPLVPKSEWGQANTYPNIIVLITLVLSGGLIIKSLRKQNGK